MFSTRALDIKVVFISLCIVYCSTHCDGRPLRKRSVGEVQYMHNLGEHKHVVERQDWLQMKLRDIHTASLKNSLAQGDKVRTRRLLPEDLPGLGELTPQEVEYLLNLLEKLLNSQ